MSNTRDLNSSGDLLGCKTLGGKAGSCGTTNLGGSGHNMDQLSKLLEMPNRFRALADLDPDQSTAQEEHTEEASPDLGDQLRCANTATQREQI